MAGHLNTKTTGLYERRNNDSGKTSYGNPNNMNCETAGTRWASVSRNVMLDLHVRTAGGSREKASVRRIGSWLGWMRRRWKWRGEYTASPIGFDLRHTYDCEC